MRTLKTSLLKFSTVKFLEVLGVQANLLLLRKKNLAEEGIWWAHVVFADTRNGGCVARKVEIDTSAKHNGKWYYRIGRNGYEVVK